MRRRDETEAAKGYRNRRERERENLPGKGTRDRLGKEESRREGSRNDTDPAKLYRLST